MTDRQVKLFLAVAAAYFGLGIVFGFVEFDEIVRSVATVVVMLVIIRIVSQESYRKGYERGREESSR